MLILPSQAEPKQKGNKPNKRTNRRAMNRESGRRLLESRNIEYCTSNDGIHLIVTGNYGLIDFWPGNGKWKARANRMSGFGVFNLIEMIESGQL